MLSTEHGKTTLINSNFELEMSRETFETLCFHCGYTDQWEKEVKSISAICSATFCNAGHEAGTYFAILSQAYKT